MSAEKTTDRRMYEPYVQANWGLKNHWYPAFFSQDIPEGALKGVEICGVPVMVRRIKHELYALHDRCIHRGVKLSVKPTCFTDDSVTCWYHGFSYDLNKGRLISIVGAPDDDLIGKVGIRTFPVEEYKGMIFVFVGDEGFEPPPLKDDLPAPVSKEYEFSTAHPLDEDAVILGMHTTVNCNWRLAAETGLDPGHALIHREDAIVLALSGHRQQQLAYRPISDGAIKVIEGDGPKGVMNMYGSEHYVPVTENKMLNLESPTGAEFKFSGSRTSLYLPGVLMVENFPERGVAQLEWYVPIDDERHEYWRCIVARCPDQKSRDKFEFRFKHFFKPVGLEGFNASDVAAGESMQSAYKNGWSHENLFSLDAVLISWRKLVSRYNRGIQSSPN